MGIESTVGIETTTGIESTVGIEAIGLAIPKYSLSVNELAKINLVPSNKYTEGLGCEEIAVCGSGDNLVNLAFKAASRAILHWGKNVSDIGLCIVATESSFDMSRPLSAWVLEKLQLHGVIRSYEVKHACLAGTLALQQAIAWKQQQHAIQQTQLTKNSHSNISSKAALVIAVDESLYALNHPGEPTQGAGAIAFIVDQPKIFTLCDYSASWSDPKLDFCRPIYAKYPVVNGNLSKECYAKATIACFEQFLRDGHNNLDTFLQQFKYLTFHCPYPKIVYRAFEQLGLAHNLDATTINNIYHTKILPTMQWNKRIGNAYTASLWFSVAKTLTLMRTLESCLAFSYGSGYGAELVRITRVSQNDDFPWQADLLNDFQNRVAITGKEYIELRQTKAALTLDEVYMHA